MTLILDSDVITNHIHKGAPLAFEETANLSISVITETELFYGARNSHYPDKISNFIHGLIEDLRITILPVTSEIVHKFVEVKINLEKNGRKLPDFDILIAATAIVNDLTLVTANKKHFTRIPELKLLYPSYSDLQLVKVA